MKKTISENKLCKKCVGKCKQPEHVILLTCPNFEQKPQQLTIKFNLGRKRKKKKEK